MSASSRPADVHQVPNAGTGKGVSLQPLSDPETENRDSARSVPDRATDKNLVPEQADETQERAAGRQGDQRTGPSGERDRTGQKGSHENGWR